MASRPTSEDNCQHVRDTLAERQPGYSAQLAAAEAQVDEALADVSLDASDAADVGALLEAAL